MGLGLHHIPLHGEHQGPAPGTIADVDAMPLAPARPLTRLRGERRLGGPNERPQVQLEWNLDDRDGRDGRGRGGQVRAPGRFEAQRQAGDQEKT